MSFIVAIDGPAGTGKGTITEKMAKKFGFVNMDTGAMYRCVAVSCLEHHVALEETEKIIDLSSKIKIELKEKDGKQLVLLDGKDVTEKIRTKEVSEIVSQISSITGVRLHMVAQQRKMAEGKNVIMEGRDITTYVFPNADVKIYLDADCEERARRRYKQNQEKGIDMTYEEVLENIKKRDANDRNKEIGSLTIAKDATLIDTTHLNIAQVSKQVSKLIKEKQKQKKELEKIYSVRPDTKWKLQEQKIVKAFLRGIYRLVFRVKIIGEVPKEGAYILCANHINYLDAAAVVLFNKRQVSFVAKEDLFRFKPLRWLAHLFDIIPIKRNMQDMEAMKRCLKYLKSGRILGIFPEGTRKGMAKHQKAKNGAAYMAVKTKTPIIPVGIGGNFKPFGKVYVQYGKPIDIKGIEASDKEKLEAFTEEVMKQIVMLTINEK